MDHATCSVSFKLYVNVDKTIADGVVLYPVCHQHALTQMKKIAKLINFIDPKFFESAEIPGVGRVTANKKLVFSGTTKTIQSFVQDYLSTFLYHSAFLYSRIAAFTEI